MCKKLLGVLLVAFCFSSSLAFSVPPNSVSELVASITFADLLLNVLAVAALLAAVYVVARSIRFVLVALRIL